MRTLGRIIGIISMLCIMVGGSALDSASVLPMVIAGIGIAGLATTVCIAGCLV